MKSIPLTQGLFAIVDDCDYEELIKHKWRVCVDGHMKYAIAHYKNSFGIDTTIRMHREILKLKDSDINVDHIDRNGLNNVKSNLRTCNKSENGCNRPKQKNNTSGYKGVSYDKSKGKYVSRIQKNGIEIYLGLYDTAKDAHRAYKASCKVFHGKFARTQ